ncbi:MAG: DMT family transporter, partial [Syntrophomonadaceae bacterium]|nr:DMT family transporter [Syntrophomonadaceae bacterium]
MFANRSNELLGSMSICFSALMYATLPILVKLAYANGLTAGNALWLRYLFSFVLLAVFIGLVTKGSLLSLSPPVIAQGIFLTVGGLLYFYALEWLSAGVATIIFFSHPVFVAVLSILVYKEKIVLRLFPGLVLAVLGIVLVSWAGGLSSSLPSLGLVYALSSCLCYTLYSLVGQKAMDRHDPLSVTATISMLAILVLT